jgi:hypothetical protein
MLYKAIFAQPPKKVKFAIRRGELDRLAGTEAGLLHYNTDISRRLCSTALRSVHY